MTEIPRVKRVTEGFNTIGPLSFPRLLTPPRILILGSGRAHNSCMSRWGWSIYDWLQITRTYLYRPQVEALWNLDNFSLCSLYVPPTGVFAEDNHFE